MLSNYSVCNPYSLFIQNVQTRPTAPGVSINVNATTTPPVTTCQGSASVPRAGGADSVIRDALSGFSGRIVRASVAVQMAPFAIT